MEQTLRQLGERMRQARAALGLTLRQLAERTGLSAAMLCHIEKGQANPTVGSLSLIADALGCPPASLLARDEARPPGAPAPPCRTVRPASLRGALELGGGIRVSPLTPGPAAGLNVVETTYPPGSSSGGRAFRHGGAPPT
jgi:DNA-binding XRE family transcriptional regulator